MILNQKLTESIEKLGLQLKKKELFIDADGPREHIEFIGPSTIEVKKGHSHRSNYFLPEFNTKKNIANNAIKLNKIYSTSTSALVNVPGSQKAGGAHSQSVQQIYNAKSPIKDLKVPKKEIKLNH